MKKTDNDECIELKNINYQTMLLNNKSNINSKTLSDCTEKIDSFLSKEKELNKNKSWNKLSKANKLKKLQLFSVTYSKKNKLSNDDEKNLRTYLLEALDRRKLQRIKDVSYDIEKGIILEIPKLIFLKEKKRFTIKREKKNSTLSGLAAPKTKKIKKIKKIRKPSKLDKMKKEKKDKKIKNKISKELKIKNVRKKKKVNTSPKSKVSKN